MAGVESVDKAVRLGMDVIKWVLDPGEEAKTSQGKDYASCIPEGYTEKDLSGGKRVVVPLIEAKVGDTWYERRYHWRLTMSWISKVTLRGHGMYIQAATVTVTSLYSSRITGWVWETKFANPRWADFKAKHVELPFTITIRAKDTIGPDTPMHTKNYYGAIRGDGTSECVEG